MKHRSLIGIFIFLMAGQSLLAQTAPEVNISLLANDNIAAVNIDEDKFLNDFKALTDLVKSEFKDVPSDQKIAVLFVVHKTGRPTIEIYSKPKLKAELEEHFLKGVNALTFENTKIVDFPILVNVNVKDGVASDDFKEIVLPTDKVRNEYENADLNKKYILNKEWAINEVLPVIGAYESRVDSKFLGVKNLGGLVQKTNFSEPQNSSDLTNKNPDYWRAGLEMSLGNELIPLTKIFMHVSQGEFDYALKYLEIVRFFADSKSVATNYLKQLSWRLNLFNQQLNEEMEKGITQHDKGNYQDAIDIYKGILKNYPNSSWTLYEMYFSQNMMDIANGKTKMDDRADWDIAKVDIYKNNPLYNMDVRASNAREGYLIFRRQEINGLFKSKEDQMGDVYKYADIAMDLGVYDFAATLFWYSFSYTKDNKKALNRYLYCMEKLGITNLKQNFKGDFEKEFKKIDEEKDKEMKKSSIYKAFKK